MSPINAISSGITAAIASQTTANALRQTTLPPHSEFSTWAHDNFSFNLESLENLGWRFVQSSALRFATDVAVLPAVRFLGLATGGLPLAIGMTVGINLLMLGGQFFGAWQEGKLHSINWWDACVTGLITSLPATALGAATPLLLKKFMPQASTLLRMGAEVFSESVQAFGNAVSSTVQTSNTTFGEKFIMELGDSFLNRGVGFGYEAGQFIVKKSAPHLANAGRGLLMIGGLSGPAYASTGPADTSHMGAAVLGGSVLIDILRKRRERLLPLTKPLQLPIDYDEYATGIPDGSVDNYTVDFSIIKSRQGSLATGAGYILIPPREGRIALSGLVFCSRVMVRCPDTGITLDSHLPVSHEGVNAFKRDWEAIVGEFERLGSYKEKLRVHVLYGPDETSHVFWGHPPPGLKVVQIIRESGVPIASAQDSGPVFTVHTFNLGTGEVTIEKALLYNWAYE